MSISFLEGKVHIHFRRNKPPSKPENRRQQKQGVNTMNIAIVGAGNIGSGLASVLAKTSHSISIVDAQNGAAAAAKLKEQGLNVAVSELSPAVAAADLVILATPFAASKAVVAEADFAGKIIVDVSNPITDDFSGLQVGFNSSAAEELAKLAPAAKVVKAFNTVFAQHYASGLKLNGEALQTFVASDDEAARAAVKDLAAEIGLEPKDAGPLSNARYLEPLGYLNINFGYILGYGTQIAPKWLSE
ncbi:NADPH-dependent F420 reductase [Cohaesibacter haloalkalitolerans]|uniref:NADPH-dependent F420 reductase n=1 Tax=Cohaesibacter haloalkalitolerans TaxID=1162980 RepID=UPI000E64E322|nr:NADPH-dependent F420 reductase [Cohaesibacter haloalkalitolerans]